MRRKTLSGMLIAAVAVAAVVAGSSRRAKAEDPDIAAKRERCAIRLAIAFTGLSPSEALLGSADPQSQVDTLLKAPEFHDRYASFINKSFNRTQGPSAAADAPYALSRRILETNKPWKDLFVGPYKVVANQDGSASVQDDPNGLGYFRSDAWMKKYAGNEGEGVKIATAFRMIQNSVGLKVEAVVALDGQDRTVTGRKAAACAGCHYDSWFALDKVAAVLSRRVGTGDGITFGDPPASPQQAFDGATIKDDKDVLTTLVASDQFLVNQCRLAFTFLNGRSENSCEGATLDKCIEALKTTGTIQSGLTAIARDPSFCE